MNTTPRAYIRFFPGDGRHVPYLRRPQRRVFWFTATTTIPWEVPTYFLFGEVTCAPPVELTFPRECGGPAMCGRLPV